MPVSSPESRVDAPPPPAPPQALGEAFKLSLAPSKEAFAAGEPVTLRMALLNTTAKPVVVYRPAGSQVRLSATDESGKAADCKPPRALRKVDAARFVTVAAGSSVERDLDAARRCALAPGKWKVRAELVLGPELDGSPFGLAASTGMVVGEETVHVVPTPKPGLALTARPVARESKAGGPATLELSLWNLAEDTGQLAAGTPVRLSATRADGQPVECKPEPRGPEAAKAAPVAAGGRARRRIDAAEYCLLGTPGTYRVRAEMDGPDGRPLTSGWVRLTRAAPDARWTLQLVARLRLGSPSGRPVIDARLVNAGATGARVLRFTPRFLMARLQEYDGAEITCDREPPPPDPGLDKDRFQVLPAGGSIGGALDLGRRCGTLPRGKYRIKVAYDLPERFSGSEVGIRAWTGRAEAQEMVLEVPAPLDLELTAAPSRESWIVGEDPTLTVGIHNRSDAPVLLFRPRASFLSLWISGPEGRARCTPPGPTLEGRVRPEDWLVLDGGATHEILLSLAGCARLRSGRHELRVEYSAPAPLGGREGLGMDSFAGTLRAPPSAFAINPVPPEPSLTLRLSRDAGPAVMGRPVAVSVSAHSLGLSPVDVPQDLAAGVELSAENEGGTLECPVPAKAPGRALSGGESARGELDLAERCKLRAGSWKVRASYGGVVSAPLTMDVDDQAGATALSLSGRVVPGRPALLFLELRNDGAPVWLPAPLGERLAVEAVAQAGTLVCAPGRGPGSAAVGDYLRLGKGSAVRLVASAGGACQGLAAGETKFVARLRIPAAADGRARGLPSYSGELAAELTGTLALGPPAAPRLDVSLAALAPAAPGSPAPALLALSNSGPLPVALDKLRVVLNAENAAGQSVACRGNAASLRESTTLAPSEILLWTVDLARICNLGLGWYSVSPRVIARGIAPAWAGALAGAAAFVAVGAGDNAPPVQSRAGLLADTFSRAPPRPPVEPSLRATGADGGEKLGEPRLVSDQLKACIDEWLESQGKNAYGDAPGTAYAGGPLYDERTGKRIDRYQYLLQRFPELWSCRGE